jgi:hypothetical protein
LIIIISNNAVISYQFSADFIDNSLFVLIDPDPRTRPFSDSKKKRSVCVEVSHWFWANDLGVSGK